MAPPRHTSAVPAVYEVMERATVRDTALGPPAGVRAAARPAVTGEELVTEYLPRIHRFAVMVSPPGTDPKELAQDACVRVMERAGQFDPRRGTADAWLWRIVVNLARDAGRGARRAELLAGRLLVRARHQPPPASPETVALERLRDRDLVEAVRRLPRRYRTLVALRYGAGLSAAEVAACLGTTRMATAKALRRALDRLRADLRTPEVEP